MKNKAIKRLILLLLPAMFLTGCNSNSKKTMLYGDYEANCGKEVLTYLKYKEDYDLGCSIEKDRSRYDIYIFKYKDTDKNKDYREVFINNAPREFVEKHFGEDF